MRQVGAGHGPQVLSCEPSAELWVVATDEVMPPADVFVCVATVTLKVPVKPSSVMASALMA